MARVALGTEGDGTGFWINSDMVMKETEVRVFVDGVEEYARVLWFPDGSHVRISGDDITTYDTAVGV
jgi:hypothetical protein